MHVCLSVCLSARISQKTTCPNFTEFHVHVAHSSVDDSAICIYYVLPVLCMTSRFHIMEGIGQNQRRRAYVSSSSPNGGAGGEVRLHHAWKYVHGVHSGISTRTLHHRGKCLRSPTTVSRYGLRRLDISNYQPGQRSFSFSRPAVRKSSPCVGVSYIQRQTIP